MILAAHGATHRGRRPTNEDALLIDLDAGLFVVADGMGGHNAGEVASGLAVEAVGRVVRTATGKTPTLLEQAVRQANDDIFTAAGKRSGCAGMGTTVVAALVTAGGIAITSVGDSRVYRLRDGQLAQLTVDDSWICKMRPDGPPLTPAEIDQHPMRHVLTDVVGVRGDLQPRATEEALASGDLYLLCSDGLHGAVPPHELTEMLNPARDVVAVTDELVRRALNAGASDNVTAVVVRCDA
jgi:protein phosphatase